MKQPKDDGFENAWQEAFEKVSIAPPEIIWKNIESALPTENLGVKPSAEGIATTTKLIIGTGIILISGLSYFYLNNSSTNIYSTKLNQSNHAKNFTKLDQSANLDAKIANENLVSSTPFVAKKRSISQIKKNSITNNSDFEEAPKASEILPIEEIILTKIEEKVYEIQPKGLKMPKITMDKPDLIPNTDSQIVSPNIYFDKNALPIQQKKRGGILRDFKISGGIRVSN